MKRRSAEAEARANRSSRERPSNRAATRDRASALLQASGRRQPLTQAVAQSIAYWGGGVAVVPGAGSPPWA